MVLGDPVAARKIYYKRNITTYINTFKKQGELKYNIYTDSDMALQRLDDLFSQHIERRDRTPFPSQFVSEEIRKFFKMFMARLHPKGWVQFSSLTLNDEFLALYISFEYNQVLYLYTTSFNMRYSKWSPGQVILRYLFDYAIEHNIKQLDFARGDETYKDRFSNVFKQNRKIIIYKNNFHKKCADGFHKFRYSKTIDLLYRNARVQSMKTTFLYHKRVNGIATATYQGLAELFKGNRRIEKQA
jgi:CelD/BcsL family acetyltransferase involved in cellulose biosynthesis